MHTGESRCLTDCSVPSVLDRNLGREARVSGVSYVPFVRLAVWISLSRSVEVHEPRCAID